jgi:hypothetical protein
VFEWLFILTVVVLFMLPHRADAAVWDGAGDGNNDHTIPIMDCAVGNLDYRELLEMTTQDGRVTEREQVLLAVNCQNLVRLAMAEHGFRMPEAVVEQFELFDRVLTRYLMRAQRHDDQAQ